MPTQCSSIQDSETSFSLLFWILRLFLKKKADMFCLVSFVIAPPRCECMVNDLQGIGGHKYDFPVAAFLLAFSAISSSRDILFEELPPPLYFLFLLSSPKAWIIKTKFSRRKEWLLFKEKCLDPIATLLPIPDYCRMSQTRIHNQPIV